MSPFTTAGFARMIERATAGAELEIKAHPHMLRHACGYALANKGHDTRAIQGWLGHRSTTSTASTRRWRRTGSGSSGGTDHQTG
jgi:site-specific recombinase XerD